MKPAYGSVTLQAGSLTSGICGIQLVPKEWLANDVTVDFNTGKVTTPISLAAGKTWLAFDFAPNTYEYEEKPKSNKSGDYYEINLAGVINYHSPDLQQILETLKNTQLVGLVTDKQKRLKVIGNKWFAMLFNVYHKNTNNQNGQQTAAVTFTFETEDAPPYYEI